LLASLESKLQVLRVGPGTMEGVEMGPLVTREHRDRVADYIELGVAEGARLVVDGRTHPAAASGPGFFLGPTLFDEVRPTMRIWREEIFGPVLVMLQAASLAEALAIVNAHEFGNGASIFTGDGRVATEFGRAVLAGMVGVNVAIPVPMAFHSFGGWKRSLFGDMHVHGPEGVRFCTRLKTMTARWPAGERAAADFRMPTMS
jgi:malonate-semialdehyde dehydrogenase (acetylating)/methylmalonate-semialdehyde dehydrogenase